MLVVLKSLRRRLSYIHEYSNLSFCIVSFYDGLIRYLRRYQRLPFFGRLVSIKIKDYSNPFFVRLGRADWFVFEEVFLERIYQGLFSKYSGEIDTIIDLGANVGFTIRLWKHRWPRVMIIALEPEQGNFKLCIQNTAGLDRINVINACIGGFARPVKLRLNAVDSNYQMENMDSKTQSAQTVEAITIPMLLKAFEIRGSIDLLKCDIEGAEEELFLNCSEWIQKVRNLLVEVHGQYTIGKLMNDITRNGGEFSCELLPDSTDNVYFLTNNRILNN